MESIIDFFKNTTLKEWFFLLFGSVIGYLTNLIFYLKSKNDSNEKNLDRLFNLYDRTLNKPNFENKIEDLKREIGTKNTLESLSTEIKSIKDKLEKSPTSDDVLKYKLLGDKWSDKYLQTIEPRILTKDGLLFYTSILEFHKTIFPPDFAWSGKIRTNDVVISGTFGTLLPSTGKGTVEYNIKPVRHEDVFEKMERYCNKWNTNVDRLIKESPENKIDAIANLHHEFQIIHPFIDGNGRVGRVILDDMTSYLLNKKMKTQYDREEYYSVLRLADLGQIEPLKKFIFDNLKNE
jgi:fido (protein-threonine AMPylation protein)